MNIMKARLLPLWLVVLLPLVALAWVIRGPFLLERRVEMDVTARNAGEAWSLEWLDRSGGAINGRYLQLPATSGDLTARVESPVSNQRFTTLLLRWRGMPGLEVQDPKNVILTDRVLWWSVRTPLERRHNFLGNVERKDGVNRSTTADGGIAWAIPPFTMAMVADALVLYAIVAAGLLVIWTAYHIKDGRGWYTPERAAFTLVLGVHAWLSVRAPLAYCPDSMDYFVNTKQLIEEGIWNQFNTLRLPGYTLFTAPMLAWTHEFSLALGITQGVLAVLTAFMCGRIVAAFIPRRESGHPWSALTMLLVGLDPVLITYERLGMPECLTAFLCVLCIYLSVQRRFWAERSLSVAALGSMGLGVLLAAACYVRGNMTLAAAVVPLAAGAWALVGTDRPQWRRAFLITGLTWATVAGGIAPWLAYMHDKYGRVAFVLATGYGRCVNLADTDREDLNQTAVFGRERWENIAARRADGRLNGHQVMSELGLQEGTRLSEHIRGLHNWTAKDDASRVVADETAARNPEVHWAHSLRALCMQFALWPIEPVWKDNEKWSGPLRGVPARHGNWWTKPENYKHFKRELTQDIYERTHSDDDRWTRSDESEVFAYWWSLAAQARPLWAALVVIGALAAITRRQWVLLIIGTLVLAHASVLAFHVLTGIDRYQAPMYPLMSVLAVYAIACLAGAAPVAGVQGPETTARSRTRQVS